MRDSGQANALRFDVVLAVYDSDPDAFDILEVLIEIDGATL